MAGAIGAFGFLVVVVAELVSLVAWSKAGFATPAYVFMRGPLPLLALMISVTTQAAAGWILVARRPDNRVGWAVVAFSVLVGISVPVITATAQDPIGASPAVAWAAWFVGTLGFALASFLAFSLAFIFPPARRRAPTLLRLSRDYC